MLFALLALCEGNTPYRFTISDLCIVPMKVLCLMRNSVQWDPGNDRSPINGYKWSPHHGFTVVDLTTSIEDEIVMWLPFNLSLRCDTTDYAVTGSGHHVSGRCPGWPDRHQAICNQHDDSPGSNNVTHFVSRNIQIVMLSIQIISGSSASRWFICYCRVRLLTTLSHDIDTEWN